MWKAAWKSLLGHKLRLILSALSVVLGIAFLSGSLTFTGMLKQTFDSITQGTIADVNVGVKGSFDVTSTLTPDYARTHLSDAEIDKIRAVDGVESASGTTSSFNSIYLLGTDGRVVASSGAPSVAANYMSEPAMNHQPGIVVKQGRAPRADNEVAVDPSSLSRSGYAIGDQVGVLTPSGTIRMTLVGALTWGSGGTAGASYLFFDNAATTKLIMGGVPGFHGAAVTVKRGEDPSVVAQRVASVIPAGFEAQPGSVIAQQVSTYIDQSVSFINIFLGVFAAISLVVAGFLIVNTFTILVAQRGRELALYRALGASRAQVARSVLFEAFAIGLIGGVFGLLLGALLAFGIGRLITALGLDIGSAVPMPSPSTIVISLLAGVVMTMLAAWIPAQRAGRVPPVAAMSGEFASGQGGLGRRTFIGGGIALVGFAGLITGVALHFGDRVWVLGGGAFLMLIGVALVSPIAGRPLIWLLGRLYRRFFGEPGKLAELNAVRQPRRTAATASALMIGLALVTMMAILGSSASTSVYHLIRDNLRGDFIITTVNQQPLPTGLYDQVSKIQGVDSVHRERRVVTRIDQKPAFLQGYPAADFNQLVTQTMVQGTMTDNLGDVIVSQTWAHDNGHSLGDRLTALNPTTGEPLQLTITGVFTTPRGVDSGGINTNLATLAAMGNKDKDSQLVVTLAPGASAADVESALKAETASNPLTVVQSQNDYAQQQGAQIDRLVTMIYALLGLAVVIAVLGIVNTLALSVIERTREIGLLRAVGMKRSQLRRMITLESVIIALLGAVLGMALGLVFGLALQRVLVDEGLSWLAIPWGQLGVFLLLSIAVGILAAIVPAQRAAKQNMLTAIAAE
ncbi:putative ABC transport system permease protein [Propionibacterium cyclohexanicum]|uniref:Putative ABC transport system permease protein n=2 Tax=Propionibacterium cyclohexanicum TaxID=64702 RepID=A0A1H9TRN0_9ACTN|nr:putative ABC transport system permease protein [Propionibacterium cyclohexanicum]